MFIHYLKIAWRNLLKYKIQNTISVLSLAVGVVCFAITLYIMKSVVLDIYLSEIDKSVVTVHLYKMTEEQYKNRKTLDENFADIQLDDEEWLDHNIYTRLNECDIPSMRDAHFASVFMGKDTEYETKEGERKILKSTYGVCSPRFFHYKWYTSAVTGERIPEMKEGTVLITADIRDKVYGKGADPRGLAIYDAFNGETVTIDDVLNTADHLDDSFSGIFIVGKVPPPIYRSKGLRIELVPGTTAAQLHKELSSAMPEYYFTYTVNDFDWGDEGVIAVVFVFAILFLGCSVLLIAAVGYLKMQLQLFSLRSRELALRRIMGARPRQLIALLAIEILIVFILTSFVSVVIVSALAHYALPVIYKIHGGIVFNLDAIYSTSQWVILCTLLVTVLVASAIVQRQLRKPVGLRVGRSGHPRTVGQSIMISVQMAVSMFLILAILGLFYLINDTYSEQRDVLPDDSSRYRRALVVGGAFLGEADHLPDLKNKLMHTGTIEHISFAILKPLTAPVIDNELLMHYIERMDDKGNIQEYEYSYTVSDEGIFENLGIKITPECPRGKERNTTAVYVRTEEAERLRLKWGLSPSPDTRVKQPFGGRSYTLIGYAKALQHYSYAAYNDYTPAFWIVDEELTRVEGYHVFNYIIFPKRGLYSNCEEVMEKIYRDAHPGSVNDVPLSCLYDSWFSQMKIMELFSRLALLLVFVSILSIVASVYSSISLESRGRQKEVALRKVHGAKRGDIMRLFGGYYIRLLSVAAAFVAAVWLLLTVILHSFTEPFGLFEWLEIFAYLLASVLIVSFVTLTTIAHKIYKVGKINAADVIKKE